MITFNETEMKQKISNNYDSWKNTNCIGINDNETIEKLCNFIDTFNVCPFVKRDLKRYIKKHSYWATNDLFNGINAIKFKELAEYSDMFEISLTKRK